ncbi:MAG: hypothetical protein HY305_02170 [Sphingobacteriales bacterium]|nr:hypothetical protein [Sphingobacteriales bacterium]
MKYYFTAIFFLIIVGTKAQVSPLAGYADEWNDEEYLKCNTAADVTYMTAKEKKVIYILNLVCANPQLFANTVLKKHPQTDKQYAHSNAYYKSLVNKLLKMEAVDPFLPDEKCYSSARCHAESGVKGYVGHNRQTKECAAKKYFDGECCNYGSNDPLEIVLTLLIDDGIPSLVHRNIILGDYTKIGVSINFHSKYQYVSVLDFHY